MSYGQYSDNTAARNNPLRAKTSKDAKGERVKQVYKTDEIAHLWAHKTQSSARNSRGNFYFDGNTIYSYGSHFPIAKHVHSEVTGKDAVLITTDSYSNTTAGHVCDVRRAIPSSVKTFPVGNLRGNPTPREVIADLVKRAEKNAGILAQGFLKPLMHRNKRAELYHAIQKDVGQAREMQEWAGHVGRAEMPAALTTIRPHGIQTVEELCAEVERAKETARVKRELNRAIENIRQEERRKERAEKLAAEMPELIQYWRETGSLPRTAPCSLYQLPTLLRIDGAEVETSRGARFPVEHAIRAVRMYKTIRARGEEWERNGHNIHLGHYQVDRIEKDGTVKAGCHTVSAAEVEHLASILGERGDCNV